MLNTLDEANETDIIKWRNTSNSNNPRYAYQPNMSTGIITNVNTVISAYFKGKVAFSGDEYDEIHFTTTSGTNPYF